MACSSCGGGGVHRGPVAGGTMQAASATTDRPARVWKVKYPNSAVQEFPQEWMAMQAMAISGGELVKPDSTPTAAAGDPASDRAGKADAPTG